MRSPIVKAYPFDAMAAVLMQPTIEPGKITIELPLKTISPNQNEPWRKRYNREKCQKRAVMFALIPVKHLISLPCKLKFTRYAPKFIDAHDNLPMSFKKITDQTAAEVTGEYRPGIADSNKYLTFEYAQEKSKKYYVKIEIIW